MGWDIHLFRGPPQLLGTKWCLRRSGGLVARPLQHWRAHWLGRPARRGRCPLITCMLRPAPPSLSFTSVQRTSVSVQHACLPGKCSRRSPPRCRQLNARPRSSLRVFSLTFLHPTMDTTSTEATSSVPQPESQDPALRKRPRGPELSPPKHSGAKAPPPKTNVVSSA